LNLRPRLRSVMTCKCLLRGHFQTCIPVSRPVTRPIFSSRSLLWEVCITSHRTGHHRSPRQLLRSPVPKHPKTREPKTGEKKKIFVLISCGRFRWRCSSWDPCQNPQGNTEVLIKRPTTLLNTWPWIVLWSSDLLVESHIPPLVMKKGKKWILGGYLREDLFTQVWRK
jgi:hypothetical protein